MKGKTRLIIIGVIALLALGVWRLLGGSGAAGDIVLHGNLDLRQVDLAFNGSERIAEVLVEEGQRVKVGELLGRLDSKRLRAQFEQAANQFAAQLAVVERLQNGSRPEEIAQAKANSEAAKAEALYAKQQYERLKALGSREDGRAVSQQEVDAAQAALGVANAKVTANIKALELAVAGPRKEDLEQAEAQKQALEAQLNFVQQQLADAELVAPTEGIVRARLMEPGEMASPQKPALEIALTDPKWVRAYVSESDLGRIHEGQQAAVSVDSFPKQSFAGWVGFISPVAEFTPKSVQTEELRTSLVYEVRIFVKDPSDTLRLGMPATVTIFIQKPLVKSPQQKPSALEK